MPSSPTNAQRVRELLIPHAGKETPPPPLHSLARSIQPIHGASASTLKSWRPRVMIIDPMDPKYGLIDGRHLAGSQPLFPKPLRVPPDQVGRLLSSTGKLQHLQMEKQRRQRKDFRATNDVRDIEGAAPRSLVGRTSEGIEVRRPVYLPEREWTCSAGQPARAAVNIEGLSDLRLRNVDNQLYQLKVEEAHFATPGMNLQAQPLARGNRFDLKGLASAEEMRKQQYDKSIFW
ncbi:MAG: hypothetical protein SGPRY_009230, partial [Prymnesium sp.]